MSNYWENKVSSLSKNIVNARNIQSPILTCFLFILLSEFSTEEAPADAADNGLDYQVYICHEKRHFIFHFRDLRFRSWTFQGYLYLFASQNYPDDDRALLINIQLVFQNQDVNGNIFNCQAETGTLLNLVFNAIVQLLFGPSPGLSTLFCFLTAPIKSDGQDLMSWLNPINYMILVKLLNVSEAQVPFLKMGIKLPTSFCCWEA